MEGIYVIEELNAFQKKPFSREAKACLEFEPMYTISNDLGFFRKKIRGLRKKLMKVQLELT